MQAISKLILGTVQFGLNYGINNISGKPDQDDINEILNYAHQSGVRCLDTAEAYGTAHHAIGHFHHNYPHKKFDVITKLPHIIDSSINSKIDKYLNDLNVESLHGLLFHSYETYKNNQFAFEKLNTYKLNGKVKHFGVSVYTNEQTADAISDPLIDIIQLPFNLLDNINLRGDILEKIKNSNKQAHTRSAFLQGLFFMPQNSENAIAISLKDELKAIRTISQRESISIQRLALNYCLQQNNIDNVLIGVDNLIQLQQNISDAGNLLSSDTIAEINNIKVKDVSRLNPSLWSK